MRHLRSEARAARAVRPETPRRGARVAPRSHRVPAGASPAPGPRSPRARCTLRSRAHPRALGVLALGALLAGCTRAPTEIVVVVDSDLGVPSELAAVHAIVRDDAGAVAAEATFPLAGAAGATTYHLPLSFGVLPHAEGAAEAVSVEVEALGPGSTALFTRRARTAFLEGKTLLLPVFLARGCATTSCDAAETCTERGCASPDIPPEQLATTSPGEELRFDAGVHADAGVDAGPDARADAGEAGDAATGADAGDAAAPDGAPASDAGDAATADATATDAATTDATATDASAPDGGTDAAIADAGDAPDATADAGAGDSGSADAGRAGITITQPAAPTTTEAGGTATFTVVLDQAPAADVTVPLGSTNTREGTPSAPSVVFSTTDWWIPQSVVVAGVDDAVHDGDVAYAIVTGRAESDDPAYAGLDADDVPLTNLDDDVPGISVAPTSGLVTTEAGGRATFTVVLDSEPLSDVTIDVASDDLAEGRAEPALLVFTPSTWDTPQSVTVTGVDDPVDDGDVAYTVTTAPAVSADPDYGGMSAADVSVTNRDDDTAGITVSRTSGLSTTEAGGAATFTVRLDSAPAASVFLDLSSSDATEGTVSPTRLTFDANNWSSPVTVTVTGVDDHVVDGPIAYRVVSLPPRSADPAYAGLGALSVGVTNTDDDTAGFVVTPTTGLVTTEGGGTATFTVRLTSQPSAEVSIALSSSDTTEGTVSPSALGFTPSTWATAQTVTVTGVDDSAADGTVAYTIQTASAVSGDPLYAGLNPPDVGASNTDDDSPGFTFSATGGLVTTEAGGTATFTVRLNTLPIGTVTIGLSSSDTTEGTVSPSSLTFSTLDWATPKTVTVTGVDDAIDDGDVAYAIVTGSATGLDPGYVGLNPPDVGVTNRDDDAAGISIARASPLATTEAGGAATFTVRLTSQPSAGVTIGLSSTDTTEGTVAPSALVFTAATWSTPQTVTVTGVDDAIDDGDVLYTIVTAPAVSADPSYSGLNADDVAVTNADDDTAGITVTPARGLVTNERGGTAELRVALTSQPTANVTVPIGVSDAAEVAVNPPALTFTPGTWSTSQLVTITPLDDGALDGDKLFTIVLGAPTTVDPVYARLDPPDATGTNVDDGAFPATTLSFLGQPVPGAEPAISDDGSTVVFRSSATNLVVGDGNGADDIYLFDRHTLSFSRVSVGTNGGDSNGPSSSPTISSDGRFVAFQSSATNLVSGDRNGLPDAFVYDRQTSTMSLESQTNDGLQLLTDGAQLPVISADGRYVAYYSNATVDSMGARANIWLRDRTTRQSAGVGSAYDFTCGPVALSGSARFVAWAECGANSPAHVLDRQTSSTSSFGGLVSDLAMAPDGGVLVFTEADGLATGDHNGHLDVLARDASSRFTVVSTSASGTAGNGDSTTPSVSASGDEVAFGSFATNFDPLHPGAGRDLYVKVRSTGEIRRVASLLRGAPRMSGDGRTVAYATGLTNAASYIGLVGR